MRVPRLRRARREEIGLVERYERHDLDQMLFALTLGGLSQSKVLGWVRRFCARWRWSAPQMVEKFQFELEDVLAFFASRHCGDIGYTRLTWAKPGSNICAVT